MYTDNFNMGSDHDGDQEGNQDSGDGKKDKKAEFANLGLNLSGADERLIDSPSNTMAFGRRRSRKEEEQDVTALIGGAPSLGGSGETLMLQEQRSFSKEDLKKFQVADDRDLVGAMEDSEDAGQDISVNIS